MTSLNIMIIIVAIVLCVAIMLVFTTRAIVNGIVNFFRELAKEKKKQ